MCGHQAACKVKYSALTSDESEERLGESARALLPGANLQLVRFADLTNGTQKVGIIRNNDIVILRGFLRHLLPRFYRRLIKIRGFCVITARMIDDPQVAF